MRAWYAAVRDWLWRWETRTRHKCSGVTCSDFASARRPGNRTLPPFFLPLLDGSILILNASTIRFVNWPVNEKVEKSFSPLIVPDMSKQNKTDPGPAKSREIGSRLREVRVFLSFSQSQFAASLGIQKGRLASYESGRVPLRWEIALKVCHEYFVSEHWLATGGGRAMGIPGKRLHFGNDITRATIIQPGSAFLKSIPEGLPFAAAYQMVLLREYWQRLGASGRTIIPLDFMREIHYSAQRLKRQTDWTLAYWRSVLSQHLWAAYCVPLMKLAALLFDAIYISPEQDYRKLPPKDEKALAVIEAWLDAQMKAAGLLGSLSENNSLTYILPKGNVASVKSPLKDLLRRLALATVERGKKATLARFLDVAPARISEWIHGAKEPSGEVTLRLLEWVAAEEAQQKNTPAGATNVVKGKTRSPKEHHAEQSGPIKS